MTCPSRKNQMVKQLIQNKKIIKKEKQKEEKIIEEKITEKEHQKRIKKLKEIGLI